MRLKNIYKNSNWFVLVLTLDSFTNLRSPTLREAKRGCDVAGNSHFFRLKRENICVTTRFGLWTVVMAAMDPPMGMQTIHGNLCTTFWQRSKRLRLFFATYMQTTLSRKISHTHGETCISVKMSGEDTHLVPRLVQWACSTATERTCSVAACTLSPI